MNGNLTVYIPWSWHSHYIIWPHNFFGGIKRPNSAVAKPVAKPTGVIDGPNLLKIMVWLNLQNCIFKNHIKQGVLVFYNICPSLIFLVWPLGQRSWYHNTPPHRYTPKHQRVWRQHGPVTNKQRCTCNLI